MPLNWSGPAILVDAICLAFQFNRKRLVDGPEAFWQCGRWWIIQTSGQITLDSPLCLDTVESNKLPGGQTCQQWVSWLWGLPTHCSASLPGTFISISISLLFTVSSCSFFIHLAVSQSAGTAIVLAQLSFLVWEEIVHNSTLFWLISSSCAASWKNECNYYEGEPIKTIQTESIVGKTIKTGKSLSLILLCSIFSRGTHG